MGGISPLSTRAAITVQFTFNEAAPGFFVAGGGNSAFCFEEKKRSKKCVPLQGGEFHNESSLSMGGRTSKSTYRTAYSSYLLGFSLVAELG
jgi:hypothetical protein